MVNSNEARIVEEGNGSHNELAVHAVRHSAVARNGVAKVFNLEGALETRGEEASEGCNKGCKCSEDEDVKLDRHDVECTWNGDASRNEWKRKVAR